MFSSFENTKLTNHSTNEHDFLYVHENRFSRKLVKRHMLYIYTYVHVHVTNDYQSIIMSTGKPCEQNLKFCMETGLPPGKYCIILSLTLLLLVKLT